jgi:exodeoxyribonuclease V beta subunit
MAATADSTDVAPFEVTGALPEGRVALEASAGTGKTWTIAALVVRYVAEGRARLDELLVVTFTRAATAELRDRIRSRLALAQRHLDTVVAGAARDHDDPVVALLADAPDDEVAARARRVARALADFDAATITTIHGFCHQVLAASGFAGDVDGSGTLVEEVDDLVRAATRDVLVSQWADRPVVDHDARPALRTAEDVARVALRDPGAALRPDPDGDDVDGEPPGAVALAHLAGDLRRVVDDRKRDRGLLTFDDLLTRLADSLSDAEAGPTILAAMRARYRVALIDEFQDTDPVQWAILGRIFADRTLVLIGDPKQAIYRFRGADVHAYLEAVGHPDTRRWTLGTNHRSDQRLVEAVNRLFAGTTFGDDGIRHRSVAAAHTDDRLVEGEDRPACLQVRVVHDTGGADDLRRRVAEDLAAQVTGLLASRAEIVDDDAPGGRREVQPGDCAVLVRANAQADAVKAALAEAGVHAVINGVGSVLETPAATDWMRLLEALERPSSPTRVRALALSPLVGDSPAEVADADDVAVAVMHDRAHRWARVADDHGIATLVRAVQRETDLVPRMLGTEGGERYLADFEHIAELLHTMASAERLGPAALLAWLVDQQSRTDELPPDQRARRLESDARAVQVLTIHRAKGLQFPVVFCPYLMGSGMYPRVPFVHHDADTGQAVIDLGSSREQEARAGARREDDGELLRLLYVALTRAEHRLVLWWFPINARSHAYKWAAISRLLFCEDRPDGRVVANRPAPTLDLADLGRHFDAAIGRLGHGARWDPVPDVPTAVAWRPPASAPDQPVARTFTGDVDRTWQRASYSALTRPAPRRQVDSTPDAVPARADEDDVEAAAPPPPDLTGHHDLPLGDQPAGAAFGTVVHAVVEHVDLAAPDLDAAVADEVARQARRGGLAIPDPAGLAAGLATALRTPLGPDIGEGTLAGVDRGDRLDELEFELPLAHGDGHVTLAAVAGLLREHLPADDPFVAYPDALEDRDLARFVRGFLTGSIDLVLRRRGDDGPVFHVVDHKTNRLYGADEPGTTWHYRPAALAEAMVHSHYPLQALLYQVALHRYLRWRLAGYEPDRHLGATGYLFLRGMVGPDAPRVDGQPCGVMAWRPPTTLVTALSALLQEGRG